MDDLYYRIITIVNKIIKETYTNQMDESEEIPFEEVSCGKIDVDLSSIGMDSITFIQIIIALEEEFNIEIPDEFLLIPKLNTVKKMVDVIQSILNE